MKQTLLTLVIGVLVLGAGGLVAGSGILGRGDSPTSAAPASPAAQQAMAPQAVREVELKVDGMYCASCSYIVRQTLLETAGVVDAEVSARKGVAVVRYDETKTDPQALAQALTRIGYNASLAR